MRRVDLAAALKRKRTLQQFRRCNWMFAVEEAAGGVARTELFLRPCTARHGDAAALRLGPSPVAVGSDGD